MHRIVVPLLACFWLVGLLRCGETPREPIDEPSSARGDGQVESFDGVPIAYTVRGEGTGALVFIHGWSCDRGYWTAQMDALSRHHRVVALDLAGHGDSGRDRAEWTIESFGRDVEAVVDALGLESVVLVGHSMGGPVALYAARLMPGRTVGVIGVDTLHDFDFEWPEERFEEWLSGFERDFAGACGAMAASMFGPEADRELVAEITADMCAEPPEIATALLRDFRNVDYPRLVREAGVPIRCINAAPRGPDGMVTDVEGNRRYADFDAYLMRDVGHFPMLERPDEFNALLERTVEELTSVTSF